MSGLFSERDDALLAALAPHVDLLAVEVDVREIEPDRLCAPKTGGVHELDERTVAQCERSVAVERLERLLDLLGLRRVREATRTPRRERRVRDVRRPEREPEEAANR